MASWQSTEQQILHNFLLSRASLQDIITLRQFLELFPKDRRSNPHIKLLYREIQILRNRQCQRIAKSITIEARLGIRQRKEIKRMEREGQKIEMNIMEGIELYGAPPSLPKLTLAELLEQMEYAVADQVVENNTLDRTCTEFYKRMNTIVGDMSDLRYGKGLSASTVEQVRRQLENITDICDRLLKQMPA